jgi:DNA modification methylase
MSNLRMAIADPPYLGTAKRFYSIDGESYEKGLEYTSNQDELAALWDEPEAHKELLEYLQDNFDSFAIAMNVHSLPVYLKKLKPEASSGYRVCSWIKTNSAPTGSRIRNGWEPVLIYNHPTRRSQQSGTRTRDYLIANAPREGFIGQKPYEWTEWILDLLSYKEGDSIADLFLGSGAVTSALIELDAKVIELQYKLTENGAIYV